VEDARLKIVVSPVRVRVSPLGNAHSCGIYCFSDCVDEAINGYSIGFLGPGVFRVRDRKPGADPRWGLVRDEVTTIFVVVGNPGAHRGRRPKVGLSTLERDALDGRLEIHVVLDDADTKLHRLKPARGGMAPGKGLHEARNRVPRSVTRPRHRDTGQTSAAVGRDAGRGPLPLRVRRSSRRRGRSRSGRSRAASPGQLGQRCQSHKWRHPGAWRHSITHPWGCGITDSARRAKRPIAASPVASSRR
jgi:hypothetical protein